ncbi:anoctamin-5-like [Pectinophora gossypiella]|uniref:anoctamin-5-like n=1 Tax=Pectinophora gossypiella TaxID=13191 RepID=UPI00214E99BB|nr:anoctamin-5-like [Pectinophora gossypiella]
MDIIDEECRDSKKQHQTGYFRDGQRRIDMVLVCKDIPVEAAEQIKMDYLINAMSAGLHLEIETGMKEQFRHLMFIKVHTPDYLIRHFGYYYNMRKYFKESHLHYAKSNVKDETYLVKVLRQSYPGPLNYSTMERSLITYKILQAVTFGEPGNYVGLQRLLDRNIIIDAFPLHEGPFFLSKHQKTSEAHGRQALFYHWVGYRNLFRWQPIHLIREYLGERVTLLF